MPKPLLSSAETGISSVIFVSTVLLRAAGVAIGTILSPVTVNEQLGDVNGCGVHAVPHVRNATSSTALTKARGEGDSARGRVM